MKRSFVLMMFMVMAVALCGAGTDSGIRLNSLGYKPEMKKTATIAYACSEFSVHRSSDNKKVLGGRAAAFSPDTCVIDFTAVKEQGTYYIKIKGAGRSYDFNVSDAPYDRAFVAATRAMYLWRCGTAVSGIHDNVKFSQEACHLNDSYTDMSGQGEVKDGTGGWHDAGDYGKYTVNAGITVGLMLKAWEHFGGNIKRTGLDIPESGRSLPDFLAEIKWEADWIMKMQAQDGSVYHKISTKSFANVVMPDADRLPRFFVPWSSAATADLCGILAETARAIKPYDEAAAERYISAAEKSWKFLLDNPNNHKADQSGFVTGAYDTSDGDDRLWAIAELWETTGKDEYLKEFEKRASLYSMKFDTDWDWGNVKNLGMLTYLFSERSGRDAALVLDMKTQLIACADKITAAAAADAYARPLGDAYYWGCNGTVARQALVLQSAYKINPLPVYKDTALDAVSHLFGRNIYCRSYVTGLGFEPPMRTHDRRSMADGIDAPWPGYLVGGGHSATDWVDNESSFATNEIAINWNASLIYALAGFLYDGPDYTPTVTATGTPPTFTPTATKVPQGLIYDGDTQGYRVKDNMQTKDVMDIAGGTPGKALRLSFVRSDYEQEKVWQLKKAVKPEEFNYIEFDVKSMTDNVTDIYLGLTAGGGFDSLININDCAEGGISKNWTKARLPLEPLMQSGSAGINEFIFRASTQKNAVVLIDNIRLVNYTPPTPTISQTSTASPVVTATPSCTVTPTASATEFVTQTATDTITATSTATPTVTVTPTNTPETGTKIILERSSSRVPESIWFSYDDKNDGGTSAVAPAPGSQFERTGTADTGKRCVQMKGKVTDVFQWGYAGIGVLIEKEGKTIDLNKCAGLRFKYKGDGKEYRVKLVSKHPDFKNGEGDNQFGVDITATSDWQVFEWRFDYFTQEPYWGTKVDRQNALSAAKSFQFQTKGQPHESFELDIDDLEIYGCGE